MDHINHTPMETPIQPPIMEEMQLKRQLVLVQNPFLIQEDLSSEGLDIPVMDDFVVDNKNTRLSLGNLLSTNEIPISRKENIIKDNFKRWRAEYLTQLKKFRTELDQQRTIAKDLEYHPFPFYIQLIYLFLFIVFVLFFYNYQFFAKTPTLYQWLMKIQKIIYREPLLEYLTLAFLGFLFFAFIFGIYQNIVLRLYRKKHLSSQQSLKAKERKIKSHFKSCYKKALRHYLDCASRHYLKPYPTKNLIDPKYRFNTITIDNSIAIQNASLFKKNNFRFKVKKFLVHTISVGLGLSLIVLIILRII